MVTDLLFSMIISLPLIIISYTIFGLLVWLLNIRSLAFENLVLTFMSSIMQFIILNKDIVNARSAAKRTYGFKVVDYGTKNPASGTQCMIRNITAFLWPIEAFLILINPKRRLGDFIAGTEVIAEEPTELEQFWNELNSTKWMNLKLFIATLISLLILSTISISQMLIGLI